MSNNPALIDRFGVGGVNSALEVDLFGHVNSNHVNGNYAMNGIGGSGHFNRNAAISLLTLPSTAASGDISRVVPMIPYVDHTEHDIDIIVNEQGVADLRRNSPRETAESLIENCAHPDFRNSHHEYLDRGLDRGGHIPYQVETAFDWHIDR